jgi:hypothetical protein
MDRKSILLDLVGITRPLDEILVDIRRFSLDCDGPLIMLERRHIAAALRRYADGQLTGATIENWANSIEGRDDIGYAPRSIVGRILHELANPILTEPLSPSRATGLLTSVS